MANTATFTFDDTTLRKLNEIGAGNKSAKLRELIDSEWERIFGDSEAQHAPIEENPFVSEME